MIEDAVIIEDSVLVATDMVEHTDKVETLVEETKEVIQEIKEPTPEELHKQKVDYIKSLHNKCKPKKDFGVKYKAKKKKKNSAAKASRKINRKK